MSPSSPGAQYDSKSDVAPPVVFVHGWGSTCARTWAGSSLDRNLVAAGREIHFLDLLGHGTSSAPHAPAEYAHMADDLAARLPGDQDTVLDAVGFSLGGKLLLQLAATYPGRFRRVVIAGVGDNLFRPENGTAVAELLAVGPTGTAPEVLRAILEEAFESGNDLRALAAAIQRPSSPLTPENLRAVTCEVLLIAGDSDVIAGSAETLEASLKRVERIVVKELNHAETPHSAQVQNAARDFLEGSSDHDGPAAV